MLFISKKKKGSVLAFALIILTTLLISALSVVSVAVVEKKSSFSTQKSVLAFQAADSGAERVIKRIYIDDSPLIATVALNAPFGPPYDTNLTTLASLLSNVAAAPAPTCDAANRRITATNNVTPSYSFEVTFFDVSGNKIACNDNQWRDKVVKIKSEGFFRNTSRVVEIGIRPRT